MITNHRQYLGTQATIRRFEEALLTYQTEDAAIDPLVRTAMLESLDGDLETLRAEVALYDAVQSGTLTEFTIHTLRELPDLLILARIASRMTQKELAEELSVAAQQIQHYEATRYATAKLERLADVATLLGLKIQIHAAVGNSATVHEPIQPATFVTQGVRFGASSGEPYTFGSTESASVLQFPTLRYRSHTPVQGESLVA